MKLFVTVIVVESGESSTLSYVVVSAWRRNILAVLPSVAACFSSSLGGGFLAPQRAS